MQAGKDHEQLLKEQETGAPRQCHPGTLLNPFLALFNRDLVERISLPEGPP